MIHTLAVIEYVAAAVAGWTFLAAYQLRTHGSWRRSPEGRHLFLFTGVIALTFTLAVVVRVVDIPGIRVIALILYGSIGALLWQRVGLVLSATNRRKHRGR